MKASSSSAVAAAAAAASLFALHCALPASTAFTPGGTARSVRSLQRRPPLALASQVANNAEDNASAIGIAAEPAANGNEPAVNGNVNGNVAAKQQQQQQQYGAVSASNLSKLYDLVVIGGGAAGISGAIKAAQMGRRALLIDKPKYDACVLPDSGLDLFFGGPTGLFSKALRDAARSTNIAAMKAHHMERNVIWKHITNRVVDASTRNAEGQCRALAHYGVDYLQGSARLLGEDDEANVAAMDKFADQLDHPDDGLRSVRVSNCRVLNINDNGDTDADTDTHAGTGSSAIVSATKVLVCTGSKSTRLPGIPFDQGHRIFDSDTINLLDYLPRSVTIAGLGFIGIEFANIFNALGVKDVNILARGDVQTAVRKLNMDMDCANVLMELLEKSGVRVMENTSVEEFTHVPPPGHDDDFIQMSLSDGTIMETDLFLAATGRHPVGNAQDTGLGVSGVGMAETGERTADRGRVETDEMTMRTSARNVYAAGDVIGRPALASTSKVQAKRAVFAMFSDGTNSNLAQQANHDNPADIGSIGVWTIPAMGYYGLTKERAEKENRKVVEGSTRYDKSLRGRVFAPDGLLKLIVDADDGTVLGVHLIGKEAAELIHYGQALVRGKMTIFDILATTFTAVTYHELYKYAAIDANSKLDFGVEWQNIFESLQLECGIDIDETTLKEKFDAIDKDGSGSLDEQEMFALFTEMGKPVGKRVISNIMRLSDPEGHGAIEFEDFKRIYYKSCGV